MQAIETKFLGPTNYRGSRVKAIAQAGSVTVPWDHALSTEANHDAAARALILRWDWHGTWVRGGRADGKGNVYVCTRRAGQGESFRAHVVDPFHAIIVREG
jgi:hypothetical protein